jgi:hypothetical protein
METMSRRNRQSRAERAASARNSLATSAGASASEQPVIRSPRHSPLARGVFMTLMAFAVALKVLVPAGFMADRGKDGFSLVICTSQGTTVIHQDGAPADKGSQAGHDAPCAFAGHAAGAEPTSLAAPERVAYAAYAETPVIALVGLAPGRGLTAPPLPARGPPILAI